MSDIKKVLVTGSGMWGLWDYNEYKNIQSYDDWDKLFCEDDDIKGEILKSKFVPININTDGCFEFCIKLNEVLSDREKQYVVVQSEKYQLITDGVLYLSGLEFINKDINETNTVAINLNSGEYAITIYLIEWDKEPGMKNPDGTPNDNALSDFIVQIEEVSENNTGYRKEIKTFR